MPFGTYLKGIRKTSAHEGTKLFKSVKLGCISLPSCQTKVHLFTISTMQLPVVFSSIFLVLLLHSCNVLGHPLPNQAGSGLLTRDFDGVCGSWWFSLSLPRSLSAEAITGRPPRGRVCVCVSLAW